MEPASGVAGPDLGPQGGHELVAGGAVGVDSEMDQDLDAVGAPDTEFLGPVAVDDLHGRVAEDGQTKAVHGRGL